MTAFYASHSCRFHNYGRSRTRLPNAKSYLHYNPELDCRIFATETGMSMISTAREVFWLLSPLAEHDVEQVWVLALNSQLELIDLKLVAQGTVDYCTVHPRDVFRFAMMKNASSFILAHNHPSGSSMPSAEDIQITKRFLKLSWLHEIPLLDHLILTAEGATSLRSLKLIRYWKGQV